MQLSSSWDTLACCQNIKQPATNMSTLTDHWNNKQTCQYWLTDHWNNKHVNIDWLTIKALHPCALSQRCQMTRVLCLENVSRNKLSIENNHIVNPLKRAKQDFHLGFPGSKRSWHWNLSPLPYWARTLGITVSLTILAGIKRHWNNKHQHHKLERK